MRWFRTIAAALLALTAALGSMVVTTASAAAQGPEVCIDRLFVNDTEDFGADGDEPYLKVNTVLWNAPGSMDEPAHAAVNKTVHVGDVVQAWDSDSAEPPDEDDDFVGSARVPFGGGPHSGTLRFDGDGVNYRATYRPGPC